MPSRKTKSLTESSLIRVEAVANRIFMIRGQKVMLSTDLAELYRVEPKVLVQAVKRNNDRFPKDFMFQLSNEEFKNLKSQFVTSSWGVFDAIRNLMTEKQPDMRKQIGFRVAEKKHT